MKQYGRKSLMGKNNKGKDTILRVFANLTESIKMMNYETSVEFCCDNYRHVYFRILQKQGAKTNHHD